MENNEIRGPKAPKDPTKKRPGFCIMRGKNVAGSPQPDGRGIQFIYESDGRLKDAAKIIGGIEDNDILDMLTKVESLRKLVHSIGVSIEAPDAQTVDFAFQMYGHKDPYQSGTTIKKSIVGDGFENVIVLDECEWSDDDDIPGQIRFEFEKAGTLATVTVRLYLNDGFSAPEEEELYSIDYASEAYKNIIEKSLMNKGNNYRIKKALDKAKNGEEVTLAFLGGSITQGAGAIPINKECYAYKIFKGFCNITQRGLEDNVKYVKAGIGGTPSELGMIRYDRDVLDNGNITPDVVVVEYAVNDEGDETKGECYDSLVRKIYNGPGKPAVILLFAVFSNDFNLQDRLSPVGFAYDLPMVSTKNSVVDQFKLTRENGKVLSKSQFFYDCFHPTNAGHNIMSDGVISLLKRIDAEEYDEDKDTVSDVVPPIGGDFSNVELLDRKDNMCDAVIDPGDFAETDTVLQAVERNLDLHATPTFPYNWMYCGKQGAKAKPFTMDVECTSLFIIMKDSANPKDGAVLVYADGKQVLEYNPREVGWVHPSAVIVFRNQERKKHHIEVMPKDGSLDSTILGFGICK